MNARIQLVKHPFSTSLSLIISSAEHWIKWQNVQRQCRQYSFCKLNTIILCRKLTVEMQTLKTYHISVDKSRLLSKEILTFNNSIKCVTFKIPHSINYALDCTDCAALLTMLILLWASYKICLWRKTVVICSKDGCVTLVTIQQSVFVLAEPSYFAFYWDIFNQYPLRTVQNI